MLQKTLRAGACAVAALFVAAAPTASATPSSDTSAGSCHTWPVTTVAGGLGALENLEPDGHGGFYLSAITDGRPAARRRPRDQYHGADRPRTPCGAAAFRETTCTS